MVIKMWEIEKIVIKEDCKQEHLAKKDVREREREREMELPFLCMKNEYERGKNGGEE